MRAEAKLKGKKTKSDVRDVRNWCDSLSFDAINDGDQYLLAALYRITIMQSAETKDIRDRISEVAKQCRVDHISKLSRSAKPLANL